MKVITYKLENALRVSLEFPSKMVNVLTKIVNNFSTVNVSLAKLTSRKMRMEYVIIMILSVLRVSTLAVRNVKLDIMSTFKENVRNSLQTVKSQISKLVTVWNATQILTIIPQKDV